LEAINVKMKYILSLIIGGALVVSGFGQTRNVLVGTNSAVVQPTNFWSADASNARTGLGLGSTNDVTVNKVITPNGSASNPSIQIGTNNKGLFGIGSVLFLASGGNDTVAISSTTLSVDGDILTSQAGQTRTNLGLVWSGLTSVDASSFRSALELGTASTNSAASFQPASAVLSNLSSSNGGTLTNIQATSLVGVIPASNISTVTFSNVSGTLPIISGGTGATNAFDARINLGATTIGNSIFTATNAEAGRVALGATTIGSSLFTLVNPSDIRFLRLNADNTATALAASDFRTAIGLGTAATNPATAFQPADSDLNTLAANNGGSLTNITAANITGTVGLASNITGTAALATNVSGVVALVNGGTGATNPATARTNLGLGWSALTNTDATNFRNAIGLGTLNNVQFAEVIAPSLGVGSGTNSYFSANSESVETALPIEFALNSAGGTRTNLGLGATWLTNTSVTNFRTAIGLGATNDVVFNQLVGADVGADNLTVEGAIYFTETLTNLAVTRTNLGLPWSGLTNANAATFQAALFGSNTNPVLVDTNGSVVSPTNFWQVAPIVTRFVETQPTTNQTTNIAAARNLHIHSLIISITGVTNTIALPTTGSLNGDTALVVHQGPTSSVTAVRTAGSGTNLITINKLNEAVEFIYYNNVWQFNHNRSFIEPIYFSGTNAAANAAASRTNLGLGATWLTNTSVTNFRTAIGLGVSNAVRFEQLFATDTVEIGSSTNMVQITTEAIEFGHSGIAAATRTNLGLGSTWLTNNNVTNFRTAIGLGATNDVGFSSISVGDLSISGSGYSGFGSFLDMEERALRANDSNVFSFAPEVMEMFVPITFYNTNASATTRTNLGLGATNVPTFSNVSLGGLGGGSLIVGANSGGNLTRSTNLLSAFGTTYVIGNIGSTLTNWTPANFQAAVFTTNSNPTNAGNFNNHVAWMEVTVQTNGSNVSFRVPLYK
jgi:hypothetical protein